MKDIKVTVIIPTFKQTKLLHDAVESVLNQTHKNIEIIIVDDNKDIIYKQNNSRFFQSLNSTSIKYIQNENNIGSAKSRNVGIENATGNYITFLDDDDIYYERKVELQLKEMLKSGADYSVTNIILEHEDGTKDIRLRKYLKKDEELLISHLKHHITATSTFMFQKNLLTTIGGFPEKDLGDEFYLMIKAIKESNDFVHCDELLVCASVHNETGLSSYNNKLISEEELFNYKEGYFKSLRSKDVRYIKMRHYAVRAVAYKKGNRVLQVIINLAKSFVFCPIGFINLIRGNDR